MIDKDIIDRAVRTLEVSTEIIKLLNDPIANDHRMAFGVSTLCLVINQMALNIDGTREKRKQFIEALFKRANDLFDLPDFNLINDDLI